MINPNNQHDQSSEKIEQQSQSMDQQEPQKNEMMSDNTSITTGIIPGSPPYQQDTSGLTPFTTVPHPNVSQTASSTMGVSFPSLQPKPLYAHGSTATSPTTGATPAVISGSHPSRFNPYNTSTNSPNTQLSFAERFAIVEQVVSMFPLLEKDPMVYNTLNKNNWVIDSCINEFQKKHELAERKEKLKEDKFKNILPTTGKRNKHAGKQLEEGEDYEFDDEYDEDEDDFEEQRLDDIIDDVDDYSQENILNDDYNELKPILDKSGDSNMMTDTSTTNINVAPPSPLDGVGFKSALSFSRYPKLKEHIQTLRDIFGTTYHEFELKSFYIACNGNLELVIDQLVNDQIRLTSLTTGTPNTQNTTPQSPSTLPHNNNPLKSNESLNNQNNEPRKPITERLSEEEKRTIQLQLIEEQEKLEKKFSEKKKNETKNHPTKKSFTQQEIVKELKDLFGKTVDEGVIEWVAYRCDYDLGTSVTQLVDLKHNSLLKKGSLEPPVLDQTTQMDISKNLEMLGKQNLASVGVNIDNFAEEMSKKLHAGDDHDDNHNKPKPNTFFNNILPSINPNQLPPTTTTTTTSTSTSTSPLVNNSTTSPTLGTTNNVPFFQQTFSYNNNNNNNNGLDKK